MNRALLLTSAAALPMLADASLKSAALLLLAGACVLFMRRASASARHMVWLAAVLALLLVPVLSVVLPGWRVLPQWAVLDIGKNTNEEKDGKMGSALRDSSPAIPLQPTAAAEATAFPKPVSSPLSHPSRPAPDTYSSPLPPTSSEGAAAPPVPDPPSTAAAWLFPLWAAGCTLLLLRLGAAHFLLRRATRRCETATGPFAAAFASAVEETGHRSPVRLLVDRHRTIPVVWGLFRPRLLLPAEAATWPESQLRSVLLHELAHLRRRDPLVQFLAQLACALHWFNPLVWLAAWRLHVERERACDDLVLAAGVRPSAYAEHLLHIATQLSPARWTQACGLAMARKSSLEGRLLAVLSDKLNRRRLTRALTAAAILISAAIAVPIAMLRAAGSDNKPDDAAAASQTPPPMQNRTGKLQPATLANLKWGEPVNGLRMALAFPPTLKDPLLGTEEFYQIVVQNVSEKEIRYTAGADAPNPRSLHWREGERLVQILSDKDPQNADWTLAPGECGVIWMFTKEVRNKDGKTISALIDKDLTGEQRYHVIVNMEVAKAPAGAWTGKLVTGETRGSADTTPRVTREMLEGVWSGEQDGVQFGIHFRWDSEHEQAHWRVQSPGNNLEIDTSVLLDATRGTARLVFRKGLEFEHEYGSLNAGDGGTMLLDMNPNPHIGDQPLITRRKGLILRKQPGVARHTPEHKAARALYEIWQRHARLSGDIPGALIGELAAAIKTFITRNPTWETVPQLNEILPRLDAARDWKPAEATALLSSVTELAPELVVSVQRELEGSTPDQGQSDDTVRNRLGAEGFFEFEDQTRPSGLSRMGLTVTWFGGPVDTIKYKPDVTESIDNVRSGTILKTRIIIRNEDLRHAMVFSARSHYRDLVPEGRVFLDEEDALTLKRGTASAERNLWRLEPLEYVELAGPVIGFGPRPERDDLNGADIWICTKAARNHAEIHFRFPPVPLEFPDAQGSPIDGWKGAVARHLSLDSPLPSGAADRELMLRRAMGDLIGVSPTHAEIAAFATEPSLESLTGRIAQHASVKPFSGALPSIPTSINVKPPAKDADAPSTDKLMPLEAVSVDVPQHKAARALYEVWQRHARLSGDIPGALIGELAAAVKVFISYNPTWETVPKLNEILPRLDASHDWKPTDAIALLDEVAAVQDSPLQTAAEKMNAATIRQGEALPEKFANVAWGETQPNGLRAAWVLEPAAAEHRMGTALKARLLVQNAGTIPVIARVPTWHQGSVKARDERSDAKSAEIEVSGIEWTTMARLVPVRLGPGEFVEISAPGVGLGKDAGRGPWAGPRVGSNVLAKDGTELTLTHGPLALDGSGVGIREDAPHLIGPGWWQAHIKARLARELPLPATGAKRTHLLDRAVRELFASPPTADEIAAFATDQTDGAFDALVQRLAARGDVVEFSASLPTAPVKFHVLAADPAADKTPRVVLGPGEYPLSGGTATSGAVTMKIVGRPVGDRRTNDAGLLFEATEATGRRPLDPHKLEIPDGWGTWAIVCRPGAGFFYILHKGGARKIDYTNPRQVTDTPATDIPPEFRDEVKRQFDIHEISAETQAEVFGEPAHPATTPEPKTSAVVPEKVQPVSDGKSSALVLQADGQEPVVILTGRALTASPDSTSRSGAVTMDVATSDKTETIRYTWPEDAPGFLDLKAGGYPVSRFDLSRGRAFFVHFEKLEFAAEIFQVPAAVKVPAITSTETLTQAATAVNAWYDSADDRARWECSRVVVPKSGYKSGQPLDAAAEKIAWGDANEAGLRLGLGGLDPAASYPAGQAVPVKQFVRNDGTKTLTFSPTQIFNEGIGGELTRTSDGRKFPHQKGYPHQGFFDRFRLAPGHYIALGSGPVTTIREDSGGAIGMMSHGFTVPPGDYTLQLTHGIGQFIGRPVNFNFGDPRSAPGLGEWTGVLTSAKVPLRLAEEQIKTAKAGDHQDFGTRYTIAFDKGVLKLRHYNGYPQMSRTGDPWEAQSRDWKIPAADGEYVVAWAVGGQGLWIKDATGITHLIVKNVLTENGKWTPEQAAGEIKSMPAGVRTALQLPAVKTAAAAPATAPEAPQSSKTQPKHETAQTLFRKWQAGARTDGKIPGALIGQLARTMEDAVKQTNDSDVSAKLAALRPRLDASRDWTQADVVALLDDLTAIATAPVNWADTAMEFSSMRVVRQGKALPVELESAAWGAPAENGLRAAWLLEPAPLILEIESDVPATANAYRLGSVLKARVLFHNTGKAPVIFETETWHQDAKHMARDAKGAEIPVKATWFTGITPTSKFRLAPGEYCEVSGHGIAIGAGEYKDERSTGAVGAIIEAKEGETVTLSHSVDAGTGGWTRPDDLWLTTIERRVGNEAPMPASTADREQLIRRVTLDILGVLPTAEEIAAFTADNSPDALAKLTARLQAQPRIEPFTGKLPTGETKFRVLPSDPSAAKAPRTATAPGRYVLGDGAHLQVRQVTEGDKRTNSAEILFFGPNPKKESPHKPYEIGFYAPDSAYAFVWERGANTLWVTEIREGARIPIWMAPGGERPGPQKITVRAFDFSNPADVKLTHVSSSENGGDWSWGKIVPAAFHQPVLNALGERGKRLRDFIEPQKSAGERDADASAPLDDEALELPRPGPGPRQCGKLKPGTEEKLAWGDPVNALRAALVRVPPYTEIAHGTVVDMNVVVQNVSDKPVKFRGGSPVAGAALRLEFARGTSVEVHQNIRDLLSSIDEFTIQPREVAVMSLMSVLIGEAEANMRSADPNRAVGYSTGKLPQPAEVVGGFSATLSFEDGPDDFWKGTLGTRALNVNQPAEVAGSGTVFAVNADFGFVAVHRETLTGLRHGTSLLVTRAGQTIGRIRVTNINPSRFIGEFDSKSLTSGEIKPGDVALPDPSPPVESSDGKSAAAGKGTRTINPEWGFIVETPDLAAPRRKAADILQLAAVTAKSQEDIERLNGMILEATAEKLPGLDSLLKNEELKRSDDARQSLALALAAWDYALNGNKAALQLILDRVAAENTNEGGEQALSTLASIDEWDLSLKAYEKHSSRLYGAQVEAYAGFWEQRERFFPENYARHFAKELAAAGIDATSLRGVWKGSKDGINAELRFGDKKEWEITRDGKIISKAQLKTHSQAAQGDGTVELRTQDETQRDSPYTYSWLKPRGPGKLRLHLYHQEGSTTPTVTDVDLTKQASEPGATEHPKTAAAKLTPAALLGTWRGTVNGEKLMLSFHRPPAEKGVQCDIYFGEATIGALAGFTITEDGSSAEVVQQSAGGGMKFGTLIPGEAGKLKLELYGRQKGQQETMMTRDAETAATEPQKKEARELHDMWKRTANVDGTIPGTFIGQLATEVRAYVKTHPTLDSAAKLPKLLPRFITSRDWTQAEAIKLLDDVAYYSTKPIEARVAKAKLPSGPLWRTEVEFQDIPVRIEQWSESLRGLRIGMRVVEGDWRIGGRVRAELWLHNAGDKEVTFQTIGPDRQDAGVIVSAIGADGSEHAAHRGSSRILTQPMVCALPAGSVAMAKTFEVKFFGPENNAAVWSAPEFHGLPAGKYKLRCSWSDSSGLYEGKEWRGSLTAPELEFTLAAQTADAFPPAAASEYVTVTLAKDGALSYERQAVTLAGLKATAAQNAKKWFTIRADEEVPYARAVEVLDTLRAAGVTEITFSEGRMGNGRYRIANRTGNYEFDAAHKFSICMPRGRQQWFTVIWPAKDGRPARRLRFYPELSAEGRTPWAVAWEPGANVLWWVDVYHLGRMTLDDPDKISVSRAPRMSSTDPSNKQMPSAYTPADLPDEVKTGFRRMGYAVGHDGPPGSGPAGVCHSAETLSAEVLNGKGEAVDHPQVRPGGEWSEAWRELSTMVAAARGTPEAELESLIAWGEAKDGLRSGVLMTDRVKRGGRTEARLVVRNVSDKSVTVNLSPVPNRIDVTATAADGSQLRVHKVVLFGTDPSFSYTFKPGEQLEFSAPSVQFGVSKDGTGAVKTPPFPVCGVDCGTGTVQVRYALQNVRLPDSGEVHVTVTD